MRILHVAWEAPPAVVGGLGRHVGRLAEAQARAGHPTTILTRTTTAPPAGAGGPARPGPEVRQVAAPPPPGEPAAFVAWARHLDRALAAVEVVADVVHGHDWLGAVAAKRIADRLGVPYVVTVHATEHGRHGGRVHAPPQSTIHRTERWMVRVAGAVITCSVFLRDHVAAVFGVGPPHVVPHGVAPPAAADPSADAALRARLAGPDERLVVLAGRLVYEKGLQVALAAHAALPGVRLAIAGAGPWEATLRAQAAEGVTFLGHLADVGPLLRVADVVAVPSLYEPSGLVALEAMAAGTPCVVAATGGLRELPRDGVVRVAPGDADALEAGLRRALGDPALGPAAAAAVSGRRWGATAEATLAVYRMAESP